MGFIDLDNVSRWYGPQQALKDVSLHLEPGRIGLLGPNGAGKSTLLKILLGLLPPSTGSVRVLGHSFAHAESLENGQNHAFSRTAFSTHGAGLRRAIGYVSEAGPLVPG